MTELYTDDEKPTAFFGHCKLCGETMINDMIMDHFFKHHKVIDTGEAVDWLIQD